MICARVLPAELVGALAADAEDLDRLALAAISALILSRASRTIDELNAPHRPRSAVQTTSRWTWSLPVPASSFGAEAMSATDAAMLPSTFSMRSA